MCILETDNLVLHLSIFGKTYTVGGVTPSLLEIPNDLHILPNEKATLHCMLFVHPALYLCIDGKTRYHSMLV